MFQAIFLVVACVAIGDTTLGDSQEVNVTRLQETILRLEASVEKLVGSVDQLTTKSQEQALKINQLNRKLSHKFSVLRGMGSQSLDLASENKISISEYRIRISQITERVSDLEKSDGEVVGFSTYLTLPGYVLYPTSEVIVPFNEIITNIGGHFSSNTHKFRCPVDGYYLFMYSIYSDYINQQGSDYRDQTNAKLMNDGVEVNRVFCATNTEEGINCHVSNSAVVLCRRNSDVYVVTWDSESSIGAWDRLTTFSGFLIKSI